MFEHRTCQRTFYGAPQSVTPFVAAVLEPSLTVLGFPLVTKHFQEPIGRPTLTLALLVSALTFPAPHEATTKAGASPSPRHERRKPVDTTGAVFGQPGRVGGTS